ncbi:hypothetical protein CSAL01_09347 [Colletotrichum salicis]|uniref:Uncharacterized protein n=1 Tax=Colletotrichum salicis TaxID=1209931 RepID=A0A135V601_9PEZI|nr:hypothetical protein CSAL01_09347 [Colletotrichum salicis]
MNFKAAWDCENLLSPLDELPPRPSRPLFGQRSATGTEDALLKPKRRFQLSVDSQPEYDFGVTQRNWNLSHTHDENDSIITTVRDIDNAHQPIPFGPLRASEEPHYSHAGFSSSSFICVEALQEQQKPELVTEMIGEIDNFLGDFGCHESEEKLAEDYRATDTFVASKEPMPLQITAKQKQNVHTTQPIYPDAEVKPLFTINEENNNQVEGTFHQPTLCSTLHLTKYNSFVDTSMAPAPLRIVKRSTVDTNHRLKDQGTLHARDNKKPAGPRDIEHSRRQQTRLRPISPPILGPLFDESSFGTPVVLFLPNGPHRQLLFPSPTSIAYLEHGPLHRTVLDADDVSTVIEAPAGAAGVSDWDEDDSIDFLLGPMEDAPPSVPPHRELPRPQNPVLNRGAVHNWLRDSETAGGPEAAASHSTVDAPRPRRVRDIDVSSNDEADTPCPLRSQDVDARVNASIDALVYPIVQHESHSAYYEDDFLHDVMTAVSEAQATDLDEQLRLLGPVYPSRILLWPLHHPTTESDPENASPDGERSQSTSRSPTPEERPETPKYFL